MGTFKVKYTRLEYRNEYLKSDEWKTLRESFLINKKECERCHKERPLDVHHCAYRSFIDVRYYNLLAVCRECHNLIEKAKKLKLLKTPHKRYQAIAVKVEDINQIIERKSVIPEWMAKKIKHSHRNAQRIVCGILKRLPPDDWNSVAGTKIKPSDFDHILWAIKNCRANPHKSHPKHSCKHRMARY